MSTSAASHNDQTVVVVVPWCIDAAVGRGWTTGGVVVELFGCGTDLGRGTGRACPFAHSGKRRRGAAHWTRRRRQGLRGGRDTQTRKKTKETPKHTTTKKIKTDQKTNNNKIQPPKKEHREHKKKPTTQTAGRTTQNKQTK